MGRKKKKPSKPWCWYCNREFDDEKILIQHQKARHFKCPLCHKKLFTAPGLANHCLEVHKDILVEVPNALRHRNNIHIEIYGMEGIPDDDRIRHESRKKEAAAAGNFNMDRDYRIDDKSNSYAWELQDFLHRDREAEFYDGRRQDGNFPERRQSFITDETNPLYNSESRGRFCRNNPDALDMHFSPSRPFEQSDVFERRRDDMIAVEKKVDIGRYTERRDFFGEKCNFPTKNIEDDSYGRRFNERELNPQSSFPFKSELARNLPNDMSKPYLLEFPTDSQNPYLLEFPTDSQNPSTSKHDFERRRDDMIAVEKKVDDGRYTERQDFFGDKYNFPTKNIEDDSYGRRFNERELNPENSFHFKSEPARNGSNNRPQPYLLEFPTDSQNPSTSKRSLLGTPTIQSSKVFGDSLLGTPTVQSSKVFGGSLLGTPTVQSSKVSGDSLLGTPTIQSSKVFGDSLLGTPTIQSSKVFGGSSTTFEKFDTANTARLFGQTVYRGSNPFSATEVTSNTLTDPGEHRATVTPTNTSISNIRLDGDDSLEKIWKAVSRAVSLDNKVASNSEVTSHLICCICSVREREVALQPCGHFVSCRKCTKYIFDCPICREPFTGILRIYTS